MCISCMRCTFDCYFASIYPLFQRVACMAEKNCLKVQYLIAGPHLKSTSLILLRYEFWTLYTTNASYIINVSADLKLLYCHRLMENCTLAYNHCHKLLIDKYLWFYLLQCIEFLFLNLQRSIFIQEFITVPCKYCFVIVWRTTLSTDYFSAPVFFSILTGRFMTNAMSL